jgi:hypothetical protein
MLSQLLPTLYRRLEEATAQSQPPAVKAQLWLQKALLAMTISNSLLRDFFFFFAMTSLDEL